MRRREIRIVNVVASTRIQGKLDLEKLAFMLKHVDYEPETFSGLVYRRQNPKATLIMFTSGKITSVGARSKMQAKKAIEVTVEEIEKAGGLIGKNTLNPINVENVVGILDLKSSIDIDDLSLKLPHSIYEPDQFPSLIYRPTSGKEVVLIFASGKLVATGTKSEWQLRELLSKISETIAKAGLSHNR